MQMQIKHFPNYISNIFERQPIHKIQVHFMKHHEERATEMATTLFKRRVKKTNL